jgi:hypothetical protein
MLIGFYWYISVFSVLFGDKWVENHFTTETRRTPRSQGRRQKIVRIDIMRNRCNLIPSVKSKGVYSNVQDVSCVS